ncbi:Methyltransferase-like protein 7A [Halotydeus destructor]|nr:Methyltransferase-like protein 7A [Halotydeus destructor]
MKLTMMCLLFVAYLTTSWAFYIDSTVLGKLAIPYLMYGSGYKLLGMGAKLGHMSGHAVHQGPRAVHVYPGAVHHMHSDCMTKKLLQRIVLNISPLILPFFLLAFFPLFILAKYYRPLHDQYYYLIFYLFTRLGDPLSEVKKILFKNLTDTDEQKSVNILELGPGLGLNFKYLPRHCSVTVVEKNGLFIKDILEYAKKCSTRLNEPIIGDAQDMSMIRDSSQDVVIVTDMLCCSKCPEDVLSEIHRVLVPQGQFYYVEYCRHSITVDPMKRWLQRAYRPIWWLFMIGCQAGQWSVQDYLDSSKFRTIKHAVNQVDCLPVTHDSVEWGIAVKL